MKAPRVERVSNLLLSELKKWDGVTSHGELMQLACQFSRPIAKRIIKMVNEERRNP